MGIWHHDYLERLEEKLLKANPEIPKKYEIINSNRRRLYLPQWKGIKRNEILSNPDIVVVKKESNSIAYIFEVEYTVNYKKIVGIALLTDIAIMKMQMKNKPLLFLLTKAAFPNSEFIEKEIKKYVRNIEFALCKCEDFESALNALVI